MIRVLPKRALSVLVRYDDVEYYVIESQVYSPFMSRSSEKIGLLFHKLLIEDITEGLKLNSLIKIMKELNFDFLKDLDEEIDSFDKFFKIIKEKNKIYLKVIENIKHAEYVLKKFGNNFTKCKKTQAFIFDLKIVGEPDLCVNDAVFEIKTRFDFKKSDIIQSLVYAYLYNVNSYLLLYDVFMKNYQLLLIPISRKNFNLFINIIEKA
ncbi:MAG: hypothetical protein QW250_04650, partial [Sulfolobaceae archaeon]